MNILETLATSGPGRLLTKQLGLKEPPTLRREDTLPAGDILAYATGRSTLAVDTLGLLGIAPGAPLIDDHHDHTPAYDDKPGALIIDATDLALLDDLELLRQVLRPAVRGLEKSGRIIILGPRPEDAAADNHEARAAAEALDGIMRTVGKELRGGSTANLVRVCPDTQAGDLASTLSFLIEGRSAFVSGQTWEVKTGAGDHGVDKRPYAGRIVAVTGAARGIGSAIARVFAEQGATVVGIDLPAAGGELSELISEIGGSALPLDITDDDAAHRITDHITRTHGADARLWAIVHNAGITRDKSIVNLDAKKWRQVIDINLKAEMAINADLLAERGPGGFGDEARIVGIASTSGIAGNKGQSNYAASKAGVIGYTDSLSRELADSGITANAVAPGFIETDMTAEIPYLRREIARRVNSLSQGGRPVDVAETIAYLCQPASGAVQGQTIRVCGQNLVGK
ncbi:3-oxoacyl-ACP reductase [Corynebacterium yudongzhengii]|uniref:3-oxoacyl-ACP reductase n=1 Tax=Corynebacterium yudongzhengii TaxID=2080740 RepID=A0A2U1T6M4_9CORY|nr:3-oxoacyl-ACP reductase [Corynebacterium yudongzhengii]AWB81638.1 3-oxoacyl-ACP reductase [Corynebacterium yudongzhengii]PWC01623.1 3-oxoacyl-ACP reductase [Corynebacterium yudongzhengii]